MVSDMKKSFLFILVVTTAAAVCVSGCLGGGNNTSAGSSDNTSNGSGSSIISSTGDSSDNLSGSGNSFGGSKPLPRFDANLTIVDSIPDGFTFFSAVTVKSHGQHIGVTDALFGYQGIYHYGENETPVFLTYYDVTIANTTKTADTYIQMMKDSHAKQYGSGSKISTVLVSGHDAVLFEAATDEAPRYGKYMIVWTLGDGMFVTVTGVVDESVLESLAAATNY